MCMGLCGAQPRDTNYKPISSLPPASLSRQTTRFEGGPPPQCLTFIWINTFDQFHPPGKISLPSILPSPTLPSLPPPPQCLTFIKINTFDQFCPPGKISFCPLCPTLPSLPPSRLPPPLPPPSRPLFNASPSLGSIHLINSTLR